MIIPSEEEIRQKQDPAPASTLRSDSDLAYPPQAFRRRAGAYLPNSLPDYETSQALTVNIFDAASILKPDPSRFDRRFWRAVIYGFAAYVVFTLVVGIPLIVYYKRRGNQPSGPPRNFNGDTYFIVDDWSTTPKTNYERVLLGGKKAQCGLWNRTKHITQRNGSEGTRFLGSSSRNISIFGDIYLRSNGSYAFAVDSASTGYLVVTMNPDPSVKNAVLEWEMNTSDPDAASSICFSDLNAAGTMLDIQVPTTNELHHYEYRITLMFPQSAKSYRVPVLSTSLPYFTTLFEHLEPGPNFSTVNIQGASVSAHFGFLKAENVLVKLGQGDISGTFHVSDSLHLDTLNAGVNATVQLMNRELSSAVSIGTGNGPIYVDITLVPGNSSKIPVYNVDLRTFNAPLAAQVKYASELTAASLQVRASTMLAPATIVVDAKYQGEYYLDTFLARAIVTDIALDSLSTSSSNRLSIPQTSTNETKTGWVGWKNSQQSRGQSSIDATSSRDSVTLVIS